MEKVFLLNMKINGIKCIENDYEFDFYKDTTINFNPKNYRVKGIFGSNSSGKTAIIKAIEISKSLVLENLNLRNILIEPMEELINKVTEKFSIELDFYYEGDFENKIKKFIFSHNIEIIKTDDKIKILKEKIEIKNLKKEIKKYILIESGIIKDFKLNIPKNKLQNLSLNLLNYTSILRIIIDNTEILGKNNDISILEKLHYIYKSKLKTNIHDEDKYDLFFIDSKYSHSFLKETFNKEKFIKKLKKKINFMKVFNPKIKNIEPIFREAKYHYIVNYDFCYDDYKIDLEFESMGIKKLFKFFDLFNFVYNGGILFLDEVDLNIHTVYLEKLIKFIADLGHGELIFTAHNIELMETLKNYKNSIFFITDNRKIVRWTKRGNSSPKLQYKLGGIKDIYHGNIEYYDFEGIIGDDMIED